MLALYRFFFFENQCLIVGAVDFLDGEWRVGIALKRIAHRDICFGPN